MDSPKFIEIYVKKSNVRPFYSDETDAICFLAGGSLSSSFSSHRFLLKSSGASVNGKTEIIILVLKSIYLIGHLRITVYGSEIWKTF